MGLSDRETITVTVNEVDQAPLLYPIYDWSVYEGDTIAFTATAYDPDGSVGTLVFSLESAPAGASIDPTTGFFTWTPASDQAGTHTYSVVVFDSGASWLSDREELTVTVYENESSGPMLASAPSSSESTEVSLDAGKLDPIVDATIVRWSHALNLDDATQALLRDVTFEIRDLSGLILGQATPHAVWIDADAAGYGWFVDRTPFNDNPRK